ncbi:signal peptidase I [Enterococcus sp. 5H]|uniref:signal peptidase I n=1 Tax=Enterococcus sp. 5H TaxID=1229490 RepID=UPI0023025F12|nr:signal peptidase I [Enterococcus sp. 5H]MDA9471669.1 Signal peptidase I [Enterococcus sp. 5H]
MDLENNSKKHSKSSNDLKKSKKSDVSAKKPQKKRPQKLVEQGKQLQKVNKNRVKKVDSKKRKRKKRRKIKILLVELLGAVLITSVLIYLVSLFLFTFVKVEGYSMVPTLRDGDVVYINKKAKIQTFDLVYIKHAGTGEKELRRVIGLPGQTVVYKNDQLQIDGTIKEENFILEEQQTAMQNGRLFTDDLSILSLIGETKIPKGKYFVLGDNRPYSTDSRSYGVVDEKEIIGVVEGKILPLHQIERF